MSQSKFAELTGISRGTLINYELAKTHVPYHYIDQIINVFPDFDVAGESNDTIKEPTTVWESEMYTTKDGYYIYFNPKSGLLTRVDVNNSDNVEVRINGEWVPDKAP